MAERVHVGLFQNITAVHWKEKASSSESEGVNRCGLVVQVGRWHTGGSTIWDVGARCGTSPTIFCGEFQGITEPQQWDYPDNIAPDFFKLGFNMYPPYNAVLESPGGFAGNSGNRGAAFNFQRQLAAMGEDLPDVVAVQLMARVIAGPLSNTSQWHFCFDTFEVALAGSSDSDPAHDLGVDPTFSQGTEPDVTAAQVGGENLGVAPIWIPNAVILDSARLYVPHTNSSGDVFSSGIVSCFVNTITGQISAVEPPT